MSSFALSTDPGDSSFLEAFFTQDLLGPPVFRVGLAGRGVATATYFEGPEGLFNFSHVTYAFQSAAPVPEPTSFLLLATGLVGTGIWRHVKRRGVVSG